MEATGQSVEPKPTMVAGILVRLCFRQVASDQGETVAGDLLTQRHLNGRGGVSPAPLWAESMLTTVCSPNHATSACEGWEIGEEVTTLRCECPSWAHEACLAKSVFETGGCPTCRKSILLINGEIVLG
jgi:hypothetical protein